MMVGLLAPDDGLVRVAGCRLRDIAAGAEVQARLRSRSAHGLQLDVGEAISFCRNLYGQRWNAKRVDDLTRHPAAGRIKAREAPLQRLAAKLQLLLAIGHDPDVLILDEPTSGFDPLAQDEFLEGILNVSGSSAEQDRRRTILFSSHALADVQRMADSIALMHRGKLVFRQPVNALLE